MREKTVEEHGSAGGDFHGHGIGDIQVAAFDFAIKGVVMFFRAEVMRAGKDVHAAVADGGIVEGNPTAEDLAEGNE